MTLVSTTPFRLGGGHPATWREDSKVGLAHDPQNPKFVRKFLLEAVE